MVATRSEPAKGTGPERTDSLIGQLRLSVSAENRRIRDHALNKREEMIGLRPTS